jgi:hypothetical protein
VGPAVLLASTYHALGDDVRADAELVNAETLIGEQSGIVRVRVAQAMARDDVAALKRFLEEDVVSAADTSTAAAALLTLLDTPEAAPATLRALAASHEASLLRLLTLPTWAAYYGEHELAVELVRTPALQGPHYLGIAWGPEWRDTRRTTAFKALIEELELVDFWRTRGWPTFCRPLGADDFECF